MSIKCIFPRVKGRLAPLIFCGGYYDKLSAKQQRLNAETLEALLIVKRRRVLAEILVWMSVLCLSLIAIICVEVGVGGCSSMQLYHAPAPHADSVWLASDTVTATQPHALYVLTVASQLMGMETIDSVTHWSTAGGALRVDRWNKPGPLVRTGDWKIVDIQDRK
jgi:hypothetical protein